MLVLGLSSGGGGSGGRTDRIPLSRQQRQQQQQQQQQTGSRLAPTGKGPLDDPIRVWADSWTRWLAGLARSLQTDPEARGRVCAKKAAGVR